MSFSFSIAKPIFLDLASVTIGKPGLYNPMGMAAKPQQITGV
jgi:hypothetical protein